MTTKTVDLTTLFTTDEIKRARELVNSTLPSPHKRIRAEIVTVEVMERIDSMTGQENDRSYMAYLLEHAVARLPAYIYA